jgi:hypothetical protein
MDPGLPHKKQNARLAHAPQNPERFGKNRAQPVRVIRAGNPVMASLGSGAIRTVVVDEFAQGGRKRAEFETPRRSDEKVSS